MACHFHAILNSGACPPHFMRSTPPEIMHDPALVFWDFPLLAAFRTLALGIERRVALALLISTAAAKEST
jgi:hypothetical protein